MHKQALPASVIALVQAQIHFHSQGAASGEPSPSG